MVEGCCEMIVSKAAEMAAQWWTDRLQQGDKAIFKKTLETLVQQDLDKWGECILDCDYDPDIRLRAAVRAAGVECQGCMFSAQDILPIKHMLKVYPDLLEPKEGYGNWTEVIKVPL